MYDRYGYVVLLDGFKFNGWPGGMLEPNEGGGLICAPHGYSSSFTAGTSYKPVLHTSDL